MSENFGGGMYLTNNNDLPPLWDLDVDESGDIRTVTGVEELQKDIAYATRIRMEDVRGNPRTPAAVTRVEAIVRQSLQDDVRISRIINVSAREVNSDEVEVSASAEANGDEVNLVFSV